MNVEHLEVEDLMVCSTTHYCYSFIPEEYKEATASQECQAQDSW